MKQNKTITTTFLISNTVFSFVQDKIVRRKRETWNKKKRTKEEKNDFHNNKKEENENFRYLALIGVMVSC